MNSNLLKLYQSEQYWLWNLASKLVYILTTGKAERSALLPPGSRRHLKIRRLNKNLPTNTTSTLLFRPILVLKDTQSLRQHLLRSVYENMLVIESGEKKQGNTERPSTPTRSIFRYYSNYLITNYTSSTSSTSSILLDTASSSLPALSATPSPSSTPSRSSPASPPGLISSLEVYTTLLPVQRST